MHLVFLSQLEKELPVFSVNERKHLPVINLQSLIECNLLGLVDNLL